MSEIKNLTIKDARNELLRLENELDLYLTKKKINYQKTQPSAVKLDKVMVGGANIIFDKFTHYLIKDEVYDARIYELQTSINAYQDYIIKEMKRISTYKGKDLIVFYRDELNYRWEKIAKITNYSERQCRRIYRQTKRCPTMSD